jgi:hypothetical protein
MSGQDEQKMSDQDDLLLSDDELLMSDDDEDELIDGNENKKSGKKRGPSAGTKYSKVKKTKKDWYIACKTFTELKNPSIGMKEFLVSEASGDHFTGTKSEQISVGKNLKKFKKGQLKATDLHRNRNSQWPEIEAKLMEYLDLRASCYKRDKCGVSYGLW